MILLLPLVIAATLDAQETRGKQIYLQGTSARGSEIVAVLSEGTVELPASAMPCGSCHGPDGRGKAEGGVTPARIDWPTLTRELDRPAYDERLVRRAITMGIGAAGKPLDGTMPRYRFRRDDIDDLVAYLKKLDTVAPAGVHDDVVRFAGSAAPIDERVYDRRVDLGQSDDVFATIDGPRITIGAETFALYGDVEHQARALLAWNAAVPAADAAASRAAAGGGRRGAARSAGEGAGAPKLAIVDDDAVRAQRLATAALERGITLTTIEDADAVLLMKRAAPKAKILLVPAEVAGAELFDGDGAPRAGVVVAFPPVRRADEAMSRLVAEALRRAGRELTPEKFIAALVSMPGFSRTGRIASPNVVIVTREGERVIAP